ncbi:C40 family peptidase [Kovacikia minuta CCNUW1]|uniref:C40 family peptidase n=1 Tax=Kovacikia minuta TaxID=2931930 RepID=UPI001CC98CE6|nr:C40 family peptidase [Kovacikia minuta]UBF26438.1 C40 family peptidase [Kovacikia minuta CCNUW1]
MISLVQLQTILDLPAGSQTQFQCQAKVDLYDSPALERLATQAASGRHLRITGVSTTSEMESIAALQICLCEDDYPGWLAVRDLRHLDIAHHPYQPVPLSEAEIQARIPGAIAFTQTAMGQANHYLWGGTVGPNYDCSGLVQSAFASVGIWLPRDAYQQEAFIHRIAIENIRPGDLIFFGPPEKATHVGLYLGNDHYIHSSGKDQGRNGIGIDVLSGQGDSISQKYCAQIRGAGRVVTNYPFS